MIRSAVGPEPRSKAEPTAVGSAAAADECDWRRRTAPIPLTSFDRDFPSDPAFLSAFFVCVGIWTGVVLCSLVPDCVGAPLFFA
jgi:hypothetical protein